MKRRILYFTLSWIILFFGCTPSVPNTDQSHEELNQIVSNESNGTIKVTRFSKTNGIENKNEGTYDVEFTSEIEFVKKAGKSWDAIMGRPFENFHVTEPQGNFEASNYTYMNKGRVFYKGARIEIIGILKFVKTEKGWRSKSYEIKTSKISNNKESGIDLYPGDYSEGNNPVSSFQGDYLEIRSNNANSVKARFIWREAEVQNQPFFILNYNENNNTLRNDEQGLTISQLNGSQLQIKVDKEDKTYCCFNREP
ncbi:MAG: hypothetical protein KA450_04000 [Bacteroidia bacterium]|nr:hypothetical protein [Bacteroidia bacterium]